MIRDKILKQLEDTKNAKLFRQIPETDFGMEKYIIKSGKKLLNVASNNYLGISNHRFLVKGATKAADKYGTTSGASRIVSGNFSLYDELEEELAEFKQTESSLIFNTGYTANIAIITALCDKNTVVFSDKLNHASIIDGIKMSGAKHVRYRHNDMGHLAYCIDKYKDAEQKLLVTDTIFSMDGDIAALSDIVSLCKRNDIFIVLDEAHGTGVFGNGRGVAYELGLHDQIDVHMGTFSKGLGSFGAYAAADETIISYFINKSRGLIYTTSLPPAVIGANLAAVRFVQNHPELPKRLIQISTDMRETLDRLGFDTTPSATQIIPIMLKDPYSTLRASSFLAHNGIAVGAIRPPTVPENTSRLRLSMRADFNEAEVQYIKDIFKKLKDQL